MFSWPDGKVSLFKGARLSQHADIHWEKYIFLSGANWPLFCNDPVIKRVHLSGGDREKP
jgi:hypothetical protein